MKDCVHILNILNKGEKEAKISVSLKRVKILDKEFRVSDDISSEDLKAILAKYPFNVKNEISHDILDPQKEQFLRTTISWPYESGDDEKDTKIGKDAYEYYKRYPGRNAVEIEYVITAAQTQ